MRIKTKNRLEGWLAPLAKRTPIPPNLLTIFSVISMLAAGIQVFGNNFLPAALLVLLSGFLDMLDGSVAKAKGSSSRFGALLDRVADRASDIIILSSFILAGTVNPWLGMIVLGVTLLASYTAACLEAATKTRVGEALSWRAVRLVVIAAGLAVATVESASVFQPLFLVIGVISAYALAERLWQSHRVLR
ncbi:CDP-alcohol phosphatidyltransferase family protein [Candidatus Micrarchaeota archaeon]|nr:CDP-alcohol phosphatidyltransferase family protein [Candidatus Micrarchaeota archaeon]